jgi:hypothetical protein
VGLVKGDEDAGLLTWSLFLPFVSFEGAKGMNNSKAERLNVK